MKHALKIFLLVGAMIMICLSSIKGRIPQLSSAAMADTSMLGGGITALSTDTCTQNPRRTGDYGGFMNPAAVYCNTLGYEYKIIHEPSGDRGVCILPDKTECDAWAFLEGKCGQEYSYCAILGYDVETRTGFNDPFSRECAVCVSKQGNVIGSVTELIGLSEKCGKGSADRSPLERKGTGGPLSLGLQPPASFDWRSHDGYNWMTWVKDQGICGSCWAFSAVGAVEAVYNIRYDDPGLDLNLSEEYLVSDCHTYFGYETCCGGWADIALQFIKDEGIPDDACLPYVDRTGCSCYPDTCDDGCLYKGYGICSDATCSGRCANWASRLTQTDTLDYVDSNPQTIKEYIIGKGPLSVCMGIGSSVGGYFDGDIYRCTDDYGTNHCVVVLGYDDAGGYWIVKNSWGSSWNGDGYFKVGYGECSIENWVYYSDFPVRGDVNADGMIDVTDVVYLINYLYIDGPKPPALAAGDVDCDRAINATDVVYLVNYLYIHGPAPGC
jgi:putative hemolysin